MPFRRYAVYHTPPPGPLADFGAAWLGWDVARGETPAPMQVPGLDWDQITATPRKYGFHATLKPPFRLAQGAAVDDLGLAVEALAASLPPVELPGLALTRLGRFLALTALGDTGALDALAARCVTDLDRFRAPPSETELDRRRTGGLTERQEALLAQWGYPCVLEEFRFHMTLSGPLTATDAVAVEAALTPLLGGVVPAPYRLDDLTLAGEAEDGMFHEIHRYTLSG